MILLILAICQGGLYAQEQPRIYVTLKLSDVACAEDVRFFSQSRQMPLNASRVDGEYVLGPLQVGELIEVSINPSRECYVEGILEEARLKVYRPSIDPSTGVGTAIISPTYNGSYTIQLQRYNKIYLVILASPPKCLAGIKSDKPVKQLGEGYYRVGPWLTGGPIRDVGNLEIQVAGGCRLQRWEGPYEFMSQYQGSTIIRGIMPEKNMTLTVIFENMTAAGPMAATTAAATTAPGAAEQAQGGPLTPAITALLQTPLGRGAIASPLAAAACYASLKAVRWVKRRERERRRRREDSLNLLCMMEKAAASMDVDVHPWVGVFNLITKNFSLEDMMVGLANMPRIRGDVDAIYLASEPRCVQHLIRLKEQLENKYEEEGRVEDAGLVDQILEPALAGYLALVGAMPVGRICERLLDEATPLAQRFEALDRLSRIAAVNDTVEGFTSIARRWIRSSPLLEVGQRLRRMLVNSGAWELCNKPPPRPEKRVVEAVVKRPAHPRSEEREVEEAHTCPSCGERIPKQLWERLSYCPACGAALKGAEKEEGVEKPVEEGLAGEGERVRLEVRWIHEGELGRLCPLCGGELKETMEGRICRQCMVLFKVRGRPGRSRSLRRW